MTNQQLFEYLFNQCSQLVKDRQFITDTEKVQSRSFVQKLITLIEDNDDFDVAEAAVRLCSYKELPMCYLSLLWVQKQINRGIGNVAIAALDNKLTELNLCRDVAISWVKKQVERGIGDIATAAYTLYKENYVSFAWAKQQIERGIGDVDFAMQQLVNHLEGLNLRYYPYYENKDKYLNPLAE